MDLAEWERIELPDGALVVRGGESKVETLLRSADEAMELEGLPTLSAGALPDATRDEIQEVYAIPNGKVRWTTVGDLRRAGFGVRPSDFYGHVSIDVPNPFSRAAAERLEEVFGPSEANMNRRRPGDRQA